MNRIMIIVAAALLAACSRHPGSTSTSGEATSNVQRANSEPRIARDTAVNPTPLGFELDYANIEGVRSKLSGIAELEDMGTMEISKGPLLMAKNSDLGIEGLKSAGFIFDESGTLEGIVLTFPRGPQHRRATAELAAQLGKKYRLISKDFDSFMDFGRFRFEQGDSWIEIDSPHLSFEMTATYATKELFLAVEAESSASDKAAREKTESML